MVFIETRKKHEKEFRIDSKILVRIGKALADEMKFTDVTMNRAEKVLPLLQPDMASYEVALDSIELSARLHWIIHEIRAIAATFVLKETQLALAKVMFEMAKKLEYPERSVSLGKEDDSQPTH